MPVTIRKAATEEEQDWADDEDRWMNEDEYPDDYLGAYSEKAIIAEVDGVKCVILISAPEPEYIDRIAEKICQE